jgi:ABC-2 type transport system ATP-binding protein
VAIDELQTGEENLRMMAALRGSSRARARNRALELLERFSLTDAGRRRVGTYSGGMRRRLDLAAGLVGEPEVIFLDEPTTGLDPRSRQQMWELIRELVAAGTSVLLTTQYLEEADRLADQVAVLDHGRIIATGSTEELKARVAQQRLELSFERPELFAAAASTLGPRAVNTDRLMLKISVGTDGSAADVRALLDEVDPDRRAVTRFGVHTATLDDVFLTLTARQPDLRELEASNV